MTLLEAQHPTGNDVESTTTLSFEGRFSFGIDQWAYVPIDVPPGVHRIDVSTSHDRFPLFGFARNVLDLGIFGPAGCDLGNAAGFRGWSGGARSGFSLSTQEATPGYLAGPIEAGQWTLALGPVVLNPLGMRWRAEVTFHRAPQPTVPAAAPVSAVEPVRGTAWYRGDLHVHTVHSDGRLPIGDVAAAAKSAGLDFVVSTDHNTNSANREWACRSTDGLLVVAGEEVTTRHGHWLAVGLPPHGWVDWRYAPRDGVFGSHVADVQIHGGLAVVAHPSVPLPGSLWEFGYAGMDAIEVWNGRWNVDDEVSLRTWLRLMRGGRRITAVGSSDSHGPHQPIGRPHTVVHAEELSERGVVDALRQGRCYIAESSDITVSFTGTAGEATVGPGQTLRTDDEDTIHIRGSVEGAPDTTVALIADTGRIARVRIGDTSIGEIDWTGSAADVRFALLEVRHSVGTRMRPMAALTNPIWVTRRTA